MVHIEKYSRLATFTRQASIQFNKIIEYTFHLKIDVVNNSCYTANGKYKVKVIYPAPSS